MEDLKAQKQAGVTQQAQTTYVSARTDALVRGATPAEADAEGESARLSFLANLEEEKNNRNS
jgi:hypothetical protein